MRRMRSSGLTMVGRLGPYTSASKMPTCRRRQQRRLGACCKEADVWKQVDACTCATVAKAKAKLRLILKKGVQ
jgi:hypothetical protein